MALLNDLRSVVGEGGVITDAAERAYFSQDYFAKAAPADAVISPTTIEALSKSVALLTAAGVAVFPRGAGYSYTDAYLPTRSPSVVVDLRKLNRIVEVNAVDMYATVEAGCTWMALDDHLNPLGLRTPFWGPLSGRYATVGGSVSQGTVSLGSGKHGPSAESVLGVQVVAADGRVVVTGSAGQAKHSAFYRHYGPDLTGLFCNDAGALGLKAAVTLRLMARPTHNEGISFGFDSFEKLADGMAAVARLGVASESLGLSMGALQRATTSAGLMADLKALMQVARSGSDMFDGLMRAARMAFSARCFVTQAPAHTGHFVVEGLSRREVAAQAAGVRKALSGLGAEIANTVAVGMRAMPFAPYDMLNIDGRRQLPMHTILPFSRAAEFHRRFQALRAARAAEMTAAQVGVISVYSGISTNGLLFEPVLQWPDAVEEFHRRHSSPGTIAKTQGTPPNLAARTLVPALRDEIVGLMYDCGGTHLQIGKVYPYLKGRDENATALLRQVKTQMDPNGLINPGALGL